MFKNLSEKSRVPDEIQFWSFNNIGFEIWDFSEEYEI